MGIIKTFKRKIIKINNFFSKDLTISNKNIIVTGANSGIGLDLVSKLNDNKNNILAFVNKNKENIEKINSNKIRIITCDFSDVKLIKDHTKIISDFKPNIIINCAASFGPSKQNYENLDIDHYNLILNINVFSPFLIIQEALKNDNAIKQIVNITSKMGSITLNKVGDYYYYRTSKTLLNAITKNLSLDLKKRNINVLCIHPGSVKTKMNSSGDIPINIASQKIINICSENNLKYSGKFIDLNKNILKW